jgi:transcriptional regulator with XRE-family HTH domain
MIDTAKIARLRKRLKLTQDQAAKLAGMKSRQHWYEIESGGNPSVTTTMLDRIAAALGCRAKNLLK